MRPSVQLGDGSDVSIVIQGDVRAETPEAIRSARRVFPDAEIIFSTWTGEQQKLPKDDLSYRIIESVDPGTIENAPIYNKNFSRQLISSSAGIRSASRSYVIKLRSDVCLGDLLKTVKMNLYQIQFWVNFTANPNTTGLLFHPSDMIIGAPREILTKYMCCDHYSDRYFPEQILFLNYACHSNSDDFTVLLSFNLGNCIRHWHKFIRTVQLLPDSVATLPARLRKHSGLGQLREMPRFALMAGIRTYLEFRLRYVVRKFRSKYLNSKILPNP